MRYMITLSFLLSFAFMSLAQSSSTKRFAKIHNDKKYIITETVFENGDKEQFITSIPLSETRKMRTKDPLASLKNIEWDIDLNKEGNQRGEENEEAIENAFNNALIEIEKQLSLKEGSFRRLVIEDGFLDQNEGQQTLQLINKVIASLSTAEPFNTLVALEASNEDMDRHSKRLAKDILAKGYSNSENVADHIGYRNVEFSEHVKNDAVFLFNGDQKTEIAHVKSVYNWIFADAHTGWYNRNLLLNNHRNNGTKGLNDDYSTVGQEGFVGLGISSGEFMKSVVLDPTFNHATSVVFQVVDPLESSKYKFQIQEVSTGNDAGIAARR